MALFQSVDSQAQAEGPRLHDDCRRVRAYKRAGEGGSDLDYALAATINGISAGLRNTG